MARLVLPALACALLLGGAAVARADDWQEPAGGLLTGKQVDSVAVHWELFRKRGDEQAAEQKKREAEGKKQMSIPEALAWTRRWTEAAERDVKAAGFSSPAEAEWCANRVLEIYGPLHGLNVLERAMKKSVDDARSTYDKHRAELDAAKKAGRRPMSPEDLKRAKEGAEASLAEAEKSLADAKAREKELAAAVKDAEEALKKAESDEDRKTLRGDIQEAKNVLKGFHDDTVVPAEANAAYYRKKATNPDVPATPEEKADLDAFFAEQEKLVDGERDGVRVATENQEFLVKQARENAENVWKDKPPKNVALVKERAERLEKAFTTLSGGDANAKK